MNLTQQLIALGIFHWFILMSPGPDFLMMLRIALAHRLKVAFALAGGIASAIVFHTSLVVYAGQPLLEVLPFLQSWLPWLCGGYLLWIAVSGWIGLNKTRLLATQTNLEAKKPINISPRQAFNQGLLCNLLNPKAYLYFISLLTGALAGNDATPSWFKAALVAEFSLLALAWFCLLAAMLRLPWLQEKLKNSTQTLERITLVLLGGLGVFLITGAAQALIQ